MGRREPCPVRVTGPLASYVSGYCAELVRLGYTPRSATDQVRLMGCLSRYLADGGVGPSGLRREVIDGFLLFRRERYRRLNSGRALVPLLTYLRGIDAVPREAVRVGEGPVGVLVAQYRDFLRTERGLAPASVRRYSVDARTFLAHLPDPLDAALEDLSAGQVTTFVLGEARQRSTAAAKLMVTMLRSLLGFLHVQGLVRRQLVAAVPSVAGWKLSGLPRALDTGHVRALVSNCDRQTAPGLRDYAILTLLSRLGLRAAEVAALQLDDVDWRGGGRDPGQGQPAGAVAATR